MPVFTCPDCSKTFRDGSALRSHCESKKHGVFRPQFFCPDCSKGFQCAASLYSHSEAKRHGPQVSHQLPLLVRFRLCMLQLHRTDAPYAISRSIWRPKRSFITRGRAYNGHAVGASSAMVIRWMPCSIFTLSMEPSSVLVGASSNRTRCQCTTRHRRTGTPSAPSVGPHSGRLLIYMSIGYESTPMDTASVVLSGIQQRSVCGSISIRHQNTLAALSASSVSLEKSSFLSICLRYIARHRFRHCPRWHRPRKRMNLTAPETRHVLYFRPPRIHLV
ncbi:hypothetical protein DAEQUDRAFT_333852 [Daedalea quercina L-15889]|uniref:C2H2-type domain-containing protein n=1 Tax=Daedalea quercina L-15889 TaxID=1314783 RepID=A0A165PMX5_9APHY|nr:hypothetical protein DAEQUDRAFT_333852 [Daedalea quercina L-15889]